MYGTMFQVALLMLFGGTTNYILQSNINIALVEMTNPNNPYGPYINWTSYSGGENPRENVKDAAGYVKSAFFLGYVLNMVPGGWLAQIYGAKKVLGFAMLGCTLLTSLIPWVSSLDLSPSGLVGVLFAIMMAQGLLSGTVFPSFNIIINKWSPLSENSKFVAVAHTGMFLGTVVAYLMSGLIMQYLSWTWVFYSTRDGNL